MSIALHFATLVFVGWADFLTFVLAGALAFYLAKAAGEGRVVTPAHDLAQEGLGDLGGKMDAAELPGQGGPSAQPRDGGEGEKFCLIDLLIFLLFYIEY